MGKKAESSFAILVGGSENSVLGGVHGKRAREKRGILGGESPLGQLGGGEGVKSNH